MKNRSFFTTFWQKTIDQSEQSFNNIIINLEAKKNPLNFYLTKLQDNFGNKLRHFLMVFKPCADDKVLHNIKVQSVYNRCHH